MHLRNYLNIYFQEEYDLIRENLKETLTTVVNEYIKDKILFKPEDFKLYYYDAYELGINTDINGTYNLYLEINQPKNFKPETAVLEKKEVRNELIKPMYLPLSEIKTGLFEGLLHMFDSSTTLWIDDHSIYIHIVNDDNKSVDKDLLIRIIPCLKYTDEQNNNGVIYYNHKFKDVQIEYPLIAIENWKTKNNNTEKLLNFYSVVLKNAYKQFKKNSAVAFEVFEMMLYNVPDQLFNSEEYSTMFNILNFLRNNSAKDFKTIDELGESFTSELRSFSFLFCKRAIKDLEKLFKQNTKK